MITDEHDVNFRRALLWDSFPKRSWKLRSMMNPKNRFGDAMDELKYSYQMARNRLKQFEKLWDILMRPDS
jgi:hypothetical protein